MTSKDQISEYERFINQVAADTEVLKVVLTAFIAKLALARGEPIIDDLYEVTKITLQRYIDEPTTSHLEKRLHSLTKSRADDYFDRLREIVRRTSQERRGPVN